MTKSEGRMSEIRRKSEVRSPKLAPIRKQFDFRISDLGLLSGLGFRPFGFILIRG